MAGGSRLAMATSARFSAAARKLRCSRVCVATLGHVIFVMFRSERKELTEGPAKAGHYEVRFKCMHGADLILMLAAGLGAALILGYITQRLGLSPIVGYLIAGVVVGPHTPGF